MVGRWGRNLYVFFPHRRQGCNASFLTDDGRPFNTSMWDNNQPNDIWEETACINCNGHRCSDKACEKGRASFCLFDHHCPLLELRHRRRIKTE